MTWTIYQTNELSEDDIEKMTEFIAGHFEITILDDDFNSSTINEIMAGAAEVES